MCIIIEKAFNEASKLDYSELRQKRASLKPTYKVAKSKAVVDKIYKVKLMMLRITFHKIAYFVFWCNTVDIKMQQPTTKEV